MTDKGPTNRPLIFKKRPPKKVDEPSKKLIFKKSDSKKIKSTSDFMYYPDISDKDFYNDIWSKQEFLENTSQTQEYYDQDDKKMELIQRLCNPSVLKLKSYQVFLRNFLSPETPYNSILVFHGIGTGKCLHPDTPVTIYPTPTSSTTPTSCTTPSDPVEKTIESIWQEYHQSSELLSDPDTVEASWSIPKSTINVRTLNERSGQMITTQVSKLYRQYIQEEIKKVTLVNGLKVRLTQKHHLLTEKGWTTDFMNSKMVAVPHTNGYIKFIEIESVESELYQGYVYDLEIPEHHNYVAAGIICHNTCSGVVIAEGLKEMTEKYNKKIFVIAGTSLQVNFKNTLYNMNREKTSKYPGSLQCTKSTYYISPKPKESAEERRAREKAIRELQKRHYMYMGYTAFVNFVNKEVLGEGHNLGEYFSNTVFIIDEAHNLISRSANESKEASSQEEEKKKTRQKLHEIFKVADNTKLVLLSATPITNEINDIVVLVNLLRANDDKPLITPENLSTDGSKILTKENLNVQKFKNFVKGYISYVRGAHPSVFPRELDINEYKRNIKADMFGDALGVDMPTFKEIPLVSCEMSYFHFWNYYLHIMMLEKNSKDTTRSKDTHGDTSKIGAATIMYPLEDSDDDRLGGFEIDDHMIKERTKGKIEKYKYRTNERFFDVSLENEKHLHEIKGMQDPSAETEVGYPLAKYSTKFYRMLRDVINNFGINFIFTRYKTSVGTIPISLIMEQNGYVRYHRNLGKPNEFTGKYREKVSNMLDIRDVKYRCVCGYLDTDHSQNYTGKIQDYTDPRRHRFLQGTYIRVDGDTSDDFDKYYQSVVTSPENKYGEVIKVIVGGKNMREGIDLKYVRSVHIMNPWHNLIQIEQTIGRAIRLCSHATLGSVDDMTVKVYKYVAVPPQSKMPKKFSLMDGLEYWESTDTYRLEGVKFKDPVVWKSNVKSNDPADWATVDEYVYARAANKDYNIKYAERQMKESAIDCYLNKGHNLNYPGEKDGSRECDYTDCKWKCDYEMSADQIKQVRSKPNLDTYDLYFMEPKVQDTLEMIGDLFTRTWALTLKSIVELINAQDPSIDQDIIYLALDRMLGDLPRIKPSPILDKFGRYGYLIYRHPFYVYQPYEVPDENLPTYYRQVPGIGKKTEVGMNEILNIEKPTIKISKPLIKMMNSGDRLGNSSLATKDIDTSMVVKFTSGIENIVGPLMLGFNPIQLAIRLDIFNKRQHEYLIRTRIERWVKIKSKSDKSASPNKINKELMYDTRNSKFRSKSQTRTRSRSRSRSRSPGASGKSHNLDEVDPAAAEILKYYIENFLLGHPDMVYDDDLDRVYLIPLSGKNDWVYNLSGIFHNYNSVEDKWVEIHEDSDVLVRIKERALSRYGPKFSKLSRDMSNKVYGFLFNDNKESKIQFKVTDVEGQKTKSKSYSEDVNIKTLARGQVCDNYSNDRLENLTKRLAIRHTNNQQRNQLCGEIEYYLREKDLEDPDHIHFLNFFNYKRKFNKLEESDIISLYRLYQS
jgi:hypothetical protein